MWSSCVTPGHTQDALVALVALPMNSGTLHSVREASDRVQEESFQSQQVEGPKPGALKACQ